MRNPSPQHGEFRTTLWRDLRLALSWFYEGEPRERSVRTHGINLTAWHLLKGKVTVVTEGESAEAKEGEWLVCRPAERWQTFTESARILSIHLVVECPSLTACWSGPKALVLPDDKTLQRRAARLQRTAALQRAPHEERRNLSSLPTDLSEALELREAVAAFSSRLFEMIMPQGLTFGPPGIRDERVRASRQHLLTRELRDTWSRSALAHSQGLSPSQLDRLWRRDLGTTPRQYWEQRRLEEACVRLHHEECSVKALSYELGFSHLSRFSTWFRKLKGQSPREFRHHYFGE